MVQRWPAKLRFRLFSALGLSIFDEATRLSLLIAEVQDTIGELHPPNQVFYPQALAGTLPQFGNFDLFYSVSLSGWEQNVRIKSSIELPPGFNAESSRLECWTEVIEAREPQKRVRTVNGLRDENFDFGTTAIGPGKAFVLDGPDAGKWSTPVAKSWVQDPTGRKFIVEAVRWKAIQPYLDQLPPPGGQAGLNEKLRLQNAKLARSRIPAGLPAVRAAAKAKEPMRMAAGPMPKSGLVLDFSQLLSGTDVRLEGDKTWLVQSAVRATNLVIEGGAVVKYASGASIEVALGSSVSCLTEPYRPAVLTSVFDREVGEEIDDGQAPDEEASTALILHDPGYSLSHLRISYATKGISLDDGLLTLKHSIFTHCDKALYLTGGDAELKNVLLYGGSEVIGGNGFDVRGEHLTVNGYTKISGGSTSGNWVYLTNSVLVGLSTWGLGSFYTNAVVTNNSQSTFRTVGSSLHYLADNSPYRNAGVTNTTVAAELKSKTTYPPIAYPYGVWLTNQGLTLVPQAERDVGSDDLGFHFEPLDFVFSQAFVTNSTITVKPGTVIGVYNTEGPDPYGLTFAEGSKLVCVGSPTNLARVVRIATVQELASTNWTGAWFGPSIRTSPTAAYPPPELNFRFTAFSMLAAETDHLRGYQYFTNMPAISVVDSRLSGGRAWTQGPWFNFTNTLFERVYTKLAPTNSNWPFTNYFQNNLFYGGEVLATPYNTNDCIFRDNLFDTTVLSNSANVNASYNAYLSGYNRLNPQGATDVILSSITYDTGPLSRFYLPTNSPLINTGSVANASQLGMFWHTATANQTNEATSRIDIGLHFIALANGVALDWDGEGLPNYLEDANGSGTTESTETNFNSSDTDGDGVNDYIEFLQGRNPLTNAVNDVNGVINLKVYTPLK